MTTWAKAPYRRSFSRHLHSLVVNGFYAPDLDADDHAFLEQVRERGTANGTLPGSNTVLIEELEFWHVPYAVDNSVARRAGPPSPRVFETPEEHEARKARWRAQREIREQEKAIAAAEMERERCEWQAAQETRKLRALMADAEWEAAAPRKRKFGKVRGRHYVPQWKFDDQREAVIARATTDESMRALKLFKLAEERLKEERKKAGLEQARRRRVIEEARETVRVLDRLVTPPVYDAHSLKRQILTLVRSTGMTSLVWTHETLMRSTGCYDREFLETCLNEMMRDGLLRKVTIPETQAS